MLTTIFSIISLSSLVLGLSIYKTNPKDPLYKWYGIFGLVTGLWIFSNVLISIFPARFFINLVYSFGALIPSSAIMWVYYFCGKKPSKKFKAVLWSLAIFFVFLPHISTKLFLVDIKRIYLGGVESSFGAGFFFYIAYQFLLLFWIAYSLAKHYIDTKDIQKTQAKFVLIGDVAWTIIVSVVSFVLPIFGIYQYTPFDSPSTIIFLILTAYAITKHHLFDLKVIMAELFVFALCTALFTTTVSSQGLQEFFTNSTMFVLTVVFGILLIKSVIKEVEQREKMEKMAEDVKKAYEVEKKANEELKKLDQYKNDFMRQAQHDLRTPLTVMMGYSDLLLDGSYGKLPKQAADVIKRIIAVTQDKLKDINNFLDLEQFKMGKGVVSLKPGIELSPMLEEIINVLDSKAQEKGIYIKLEKSKETFTINADREKLKAAIFNIIDNAVKYTPKGGVSIKTENHDSVKIIISDTGIGIPQDKIKNMLETQFERTKQAKKTATGSGVGLYLSAQIIKLHNGKVWAESKGEGKGSTFYIELPISDKK